MIPPGSFDDSLGTIHDSDRRFDGFLFVASPAELSARTFVFSRATLVLGKLQSRNLLAGAQAANRAKKVWAGRPCSTLQPESEAAVEASRFHASHPRACATGLL
jgi:hypothetical protein